MLKAILLDISDVLTEDGEALPGAVEAVAWLQACLVRSGKYRPGDEAKAPEARCEASLADLVEALLVTR